jgi:hypothetical protein
MKKIIAALQPAKLVSKIQEWFRSRRRNDNDDILGGPYAIL